MKAASEWAKLYEFYEYTINFISTLDRAHLLLANTIRGFAYPLHGTLKMVALPFRATMEWMFLNIDNPWEHKYRIGCKLRN